MLQIFNLTTSEQVEQKEYFNFYLISHHIVFDSNLIMQDQRANIAYNLLSTPFSSSCFLGFTLVGLAPMQSINEMRFQSNLTKGMLNDGKVGSSVNERKGLKKGRRCT